jgi:hypothetical protein
LASVLRPGTASICSGFSRSCSNCSSNTVHTGHQYKSEASIATWVIPSSRNQSASTNRSPVKLPNTRSRRRFLPSDAQATTQAVTDFWRTSNPTKRVHIPPAWLYLLDSFERKPSLLKVSFACSLPRQRRHFLVPPDFQARLICGLFGATARNGLRSRSNPNPRYSRRISIFIPL